MIISDDEANDDNMSRTELDSHTNMVVVGRHAAITSNTEGTAEVSPFILDYETL